MHLRSTVVKKKEGWVYTYLERKCLITPERLEMFCETLTMLTKLFERHFWQPSRL